MYDDPLIAELYDQSETGRDDVALLRRLVGERGPLKILECFCGTGRMLLPLAEDGHHVTGIDIAAAMVERAAHKAARLAPGVRGRVDLSVQDVLAGGWGTGFDLVVIAGNSLYELPSAQAQEDCIRFAQKSLVGGGWLFIDNDDYKGNWSRIQRGRPAVVFEGTSERGQSIRWLREDLRFDEESKVLHLKRTLEVTEPDGSVASTEYFGQKRPVAGAEVSTWLNQHGFRIVQTFGDWKGGPLTPASERAIFWAQRPDDGCWGSVRHAAR